MKPTLLKFEVGSSVSYQGVDCTIRKILDISRVKIVDNKTKAFYIVETKDLEPVHAIKTINQDLGGVSDSAWTYAQNRYDAIKPILDNPLRTSKIIKQRAEELNIHFTTLYRWLEQYKETELLTSLVRQNRFDKGTVKLSPNIEKIVQEVIQTDYLNNQRKSAKKVYQEIRKQCFEQNLPPPHENTVRRRIQKLSDKAKVSARQGKKTASEEYSPIMGSFPGADYPLAVVQIDHTKLDIILVDDYYRRPIGRPWITLAFDVYSRMVVGFYISFDPPGALSTGLCIAHSVLPKDDWLQKHQTQNTWDVWGIPRKLHLDNAKEFRGKMLERACQQYGINVEWRPVARPHFGGHVERHLGTFSEEIHTLPGTTFSNIQQRKGYDSEGKAAFSLSEFETWLTTFIVDVYHQKIHSAINMSPSQKYQEGILGSSNQLGIGLPARIVDEQRLRLDFLPFEERSVQNYGVAIDEVHYWHDVLRPWVKTTNPSSKNIKQKFIFRRDPRDISVIWFFDPELQTYFAIPYRDTSHPPMSVWELREAKKHLKSMGRQNYDERAIFEAYDRLKTIEEQAKGKTKATRRAQQRRTHLSPVVKFEQPNHKTLAENPAVQTKTISKVIKPFDDLDDSL